SETVIDLLAQEDTLTDPFPVGRLDKDTEGLLIITNDGTLAHNLLSPKKHIDKTYYAKIDGDVTAADVEAFAAGI
ncbi:16S rRNA pseudouridine(516) synthase, partial [Escherichia coli]|nr:16S rRNA pseudouridine(516) synthase [Escherichia coli]